MPYKHIEIDILQHSKRPAEPCGDVVAWEKNREATTLVLSDGLGAGIYANLAAAFASERLLTLIRQDFSPRDAFLAVVESMHQAKQDRGPYAALTLCRILNDGQVTVLSYEAPIALALENNYAYVLPQHRSAGGREVVAESRFFMEKGSSLLLVSDGVTQAGMGNGLAAGWQESGLAQFINRCFREGAAIEELPARVFEQARRLDQSTLHDDLSVVRLTARTGQVVNILSGPPADRGRDEAVARAFLETDGIKVICGATTALLAARCMKRELKMEPVRIGYVEPPRYLLPGVDLTTEGAITLNQVCNLLDADEQDLADNQSGVAGLCKLLRFADRVNWTVGTAINPAHADIRFAQMGIWPRHKIIPMLADKLRAQGKLVVLEYV